MYSALEVTWNVRIERPHEIRIKNQGGIFQDRFTVAVDGQPVLERLIASGAGSHSLVVDERQLELRWEISYLTGYIKYIALLDVSRILAHHGKLPKALVRSLQRPDIMPAPAPGGSDALVVPSAAPALAGTGEAPALPPGTQVEFDTDLNPLERAPVYLDCAATTPLDPRVAEKALRYLGEEFGNAGSRTHTYGHRARRAVEQARGQVAGAVGAGRGEVIFTSGATESNNIAILGLAEHGRAAGRMHLVSTEIEHRAVLEPLQALVDAGFSLTLLRPTAGGWVEPQAVRDAVREDTLLVSVMHVNNETGVVQPLGEISRLLGEHPAYFHVDAAQGFGREVEPLRDARIDLISISGHKIHAPKGAGALVLRRREGNRPPVAPLMFGGGQELGLRPGTLPVHLAVSLGLAAELAVADSEERAGQCLRFKQRLLEGLAPLSPVVNGEESRTVPHIVNLSFPGIDAEEAMEAAAHLIAVSDGAACTAESQTCSHVLAAMGITGDRAAGALRFSWCHMTEEPEWDRVVDAIRTACAST